MTKSLKLLTLSAVIVMLSGCSMLTGLTTGLPTGIKPINHFKLNQYLGTWYEIVRLDNSFERGLSKVTATYSLRDDGGVSVLNKGYNAKQKSWSEASGKAYFVHEDKNIGHLKVSFFGPFYASYVVVDTDTEHQQYAIVSGYNRDYLWLLSRTPSVSDEIMDKFMTLAKDKGFNMDELITVSH